MKTCSRCGISKELSEFYKHPTETGGHQGKCKECIKQYVRQNREANKAHYTAYNKLRIQRPEYKAMKPRWQTAYQAKYPLRYKANHAVGNAVRYGKLQKQPCLHCGAEKTEAHHPDYSKPLDVVWLCMPCHRQEHAKQRKETV